MHNCVFRGATFHFRRYFCFAMFTSFLISVFSISTLPFSPCKISFLFDVFLLDQKTAKHPCKVFFHAFYWIKTLLFSMTAKHLMFQFQFSLMIINFGANLYHWTWQYHGNFGTLFVILIVMYLYLSVLVSTLKIITWQGRTSANLGML